MKTAIALIAGLLVAASSAASVGNPYNFETREIKSMPGQVTADGRCKVPGGVHTPYNCWNSHALPSDKGKDCVIARATGLGFVAKCPQNDLPYEWEWPWKPTKESKD